MKSAAARSLSRAVLEECAAQRERLFLWIPVFQAMGIGVYFSLKSEPPPFLASWFLVLFCVLFALLLPGAQKRRALFIPWLFCAGAALSLAGFCAGQARTALIAAPVLEKPLDPVRVEGRIALIDSLEEGAGIRLVLENLVIEKLPPEKTPARVRVRVRQGDARDLAAGDRVSVLAGLKPPSPPALPGAFDFQRHAYFMRLGGLGFAYGAPEKIAEEGASTFGQAVESIREIIQKRIESRMKPGDAGIAKALMTGERTAITEEDWNALRIAGLAHMISISGLHVGIVAGFLFFSARFFMALFPSFAVRHPIKKYAALFAFIGIFAYVLLVEFTVPTGRALIMSGIVLFAVMIDRSPFSLRLLAFAAVLLLFAMPESLLGASFQMSFAAIAALIYFYEILRPWLSSWHKQAGIFRRIALYFGGVCLTTVIASFATAPFSFYHFQQFGLYAILANLLATPPMSFIVMPFSVIAYVLMPFGLEGPVLDAVEYGVKAVMAGARFTAGLPFSNGTPSAAPLSFLLWLTGGAVFAMLWKGRGKALALIPFVLAMMALHAHQLPDVLVSSTGKLMALRDLQGNLWINSRQTERFTAEIWARHNGLMPEELKKWRDNPAVSCDDAGCRTVWNGRRVAFSLRESGQSEDCAWADLLIAAKPLIVSDCRAAAAVDRFDLWRNGAYAFWPDGHAANVEETRGCRAWNIRGKENRKSLH